MRIGAREIIFFGVLFAVLMASYWFVFRPQNAEITQARMEIEHKEQMLQKLAEATSQSEDLARANEEIRLAIENIEAKLPSSKEVDVILAQVADLARENELSLPSVKSEKPVASASYMEQPLTLEIAGDFDRFYSFLLEVEQLKRITRIPELSIKREDENDGATHVEFTLSIFFEPGPVGGVS